MLCHLSHICHCSNCHLRTQKCKMWLTQRKSWDEIVKNSSFFPTEGFHPTQMRRDVMWRCVTSCDVIVWHGVTLTDVKWLHCVTWSCDVGWCHVTSLCDALWCCVMRYVVVWRHRVTSLDVTRMIGWRSELKQSEQKSKTCFSRQTSTFTREQKTKTKTRTETNCPAKIARVESFFNPCDFFPFHQTKWTCSENKSFICLIGGNTVPC